MEQSEIDGQDPHLSGMSASGSRVVPIARANVLAGTDLLKDGQKKIEGGFPEHRE